MTQSTRVRRARSIRASSTTKTRPVGGAESRAVFPISPDAPAVFELCEPVDSADVLDLGCGEGYCARELAARGARSVTGVELSDEMVDLARAQDDELGQGILYRCGDVAALEDPDGSYDLAVGVFVYNYLDTQRMASSFREVYRVLRPGGRFVFSVPHPAFAFIPRPARPAVLFRRRRTRLHLRPRQAVPRRYPSPGWKRPSGPNGAQDIRRLLRRSRPGGILNATRGTRTRGPTGSPRTRS